MSMHNIIVVQLIILSSLSQIGCRAASAEAPSGVIRWSADWKPTVYLVQPRQFGDIALGYSGAVVDSALTDAEGRFTFERVQLSETPVLYQICIQRKNSRYPNKIEDENLLTANYMPVVLQKGQAFHCAAASAQFQASFSIERPSADNRALLRLRDMRQEAYARDSALLGPAAHADESNLMAREAAVLRFRAPLIAFADSCSAFWPALTAARWVSPEGDYERTPEFLFRLCEKWRVLRPDDAWTQQLCKSGNRERLPVLVGDYVPEYDLPMSGGDTLRLRALLGARLTILDIWASWCAPCRHENRSVLAPLQARYKGKGLQIVGYSIDANGAAWKAAIAKDGADWPHASHLSGDETPFLETLRIQTIPSNLILDAEGKILAKNLHGDALTAFVEAYLK